MDVVNHEPGLVVALEFVLFAAQLPVVRTLIVMASYLVALRVILAQIHTFRSWLRQSVCHWRTLCSRLGLVS